MNNGSWAKRYDIGRPVVIIALFGLISIGSCAAAPFLTPIAIEFARNMILAGKTNYGPTHGDSLAILVTRLSNPYVARLPQPSPQQAYPPYTQNPQFDPNCPNCGMPPPPPNMAGNPCPPYCGGANFPPPGPQFDPNCPNCGMPPPPPNMAGNPCPPYCGSANFPPPGPSIQGSHNQPTIAQDSPSPDPHFAPNCPNCDVPPPPPDMSEQNSPAPGPPVDLSNNLPTIEQDIEQNSQPPSPQADPNCPNCGRRPQQLGKNQQKFQQLGRQSKSNNQLEGGGGRRKQGGCPPACPSVRDHRRLRHRSITNEPVAVDVALVRQRITAEGKEVVLMNDGETLRDGRGNPQAGDKFKLVLRTNCDCYLYVVAIDGSGWAQGIFPAKGGNIENPVQEDQEYAFPEGPNWYGLDQIRGIENFYVVASPVQRLDLEEIIAQVAGKERPVAQITARVEEAAIIPHGFAKTESGQPAAIPVEQGQLMTVKPANYVAANPGESVTVTRWFKHE